MSKQIVDKEIKKKNSVLDVHSPNFEAQGIPGSWKLSRFDDIAIATDFVANGSFASLRENVKYNSEQDYAILVRLTDHVKKWEKNFVYVSKHAYDFLSKSSLEPGDVVISNVGDPGRVFRVPNLGKPMTLGPNAVLVRVRDRIEKGFISYFFMSPWGQDLIARITTGTAQKKFNKTGLRSLSLPIAPPDQQKLIVSEIEKQFSRLDEAVAGLKRIKANLKRYKASVLKAAVEGKLTEEWRKAHPNVESGEQLLKRILAERKKKWEEKNPDKKYKEPAAPDTSNLPELPKGWVWSVAEQISDFITKGTTPSATKLAAGNGEIQFLKVYNLTFDGKLNHKFKPAFVSRATHKGELARSVVYSGDVLINIVGPPLGQVSIVPPDLPEANINQAIARFRPVDGVLKQYLVFALMTKAVMGWATKRAKTTAGQANLTLELCRALPVPLPSFVEQKEIDNEVARVLSVAEESELIIDANLKRAERLRQAILKRAFSGKMYSRDNCRDE